MAGENSFVLPFWVTATIIVAVLLNNNNWHDGKIELFYWLG